MNPLKDQCASESRRGASGLIEEVYDELRLLAAAYAARERHKPLPTSLVHDAILRLGDLAAFESHREIFAAAALNIRRALVDRARRRGARKRGSSWRQVPFEASDLRSSPGGSTMLEMDELLTRLAAEDPRSARVVELRIFGGMELAQVALVLGVSRKTVVEDWSFARAWLSRHWAMEPASHP